MKHYNYAIVQFLHRSILFQKIKVYVKKYVRDQYSIKSLYPLIPQVNY